MGSQRPTRAPVPDRILPWKTYGPLPHLAPHTEPAADPAAVIGPRARFTVLTPRLIRLETSPDGVFEDRASQAIWFRRQPVPDFTATTANGIITIDTPALTLTYDTSAEGFTQIA